MEYRPFWMPWTPVIIAPARGSNAQSRTAAAISLAGHHRPCEGQQPQHPERPIEAAPRHHRPCEGQQHPERGGLRELAFCQTDEPYCR